jgi:hypothetical protein
MPTRSRWSARLRAGFVTLLFASAAQAGPIHVPGDFPGEFRMDLLVVTAFADQPSAQSGVGSLTLNPEELGIDFSASAFDGTGTPDWGTSTLTTIAQTFEVGRTPVLTEDLVFYIDAGGPGSLTDLGDGTGDWELTLPVRVEYGGELQLEADATLTTDGMFYYFDENNTEQSVSGVAMDYATGDAFLVGQVLLTSGDFNGHRVTLAIAANDPLLVPEPSTLLMASIGSIGLLLAGRRRR